MAGAAEVELKFHVNVPHEFFLRESLALFEQLLHFLPVIPNEAVPQTRRDVGGISVLPRV